MFKVNWENIKSIADSKNLSIQFVELNDSYLVSIVDNQFILESLVNITDPKNSDQIDFEDNYKENGNQRLDYPRDSDGSPLQRIKITTSGWSYQLHGIEFEVSQLDSIYSKKSNGTDLEFTTIKCYDSENNELETQLECDSSAVKTIIDWEPTYNYEIVGGLFKMIGLPESDIRLWVIGVPDIPEEYGGSKEFVSNINLKYVGLEEGMKADGRAPKYLPYNETLHTNKIRLVLTHPAGFKHKIHVTFEIFKL